MVTRPSKPLVAGSNPAGRALRTHSVTGPSALTGDPSARPGDPRAGVALVPAAAAVRDSQGGRRHPVAGGSMRAARRSRWRRPTALLVGLTALIPASLVAGGGATDAVASREFSTAMSAPSAPLRIVAGPDGNLWFTEWSATGSGASPRPASSPSSPPASAPRAVPDATSPPAPTATCGSPREAATGSGASRPPASSPSSRSGITPARAPNDITAGPDGNLWFTEAGGNRIGRITPAGRRRPSSRAGISARSLPVRHHRRPRRQPVVHRAKRQPDRADHPRRRRHRVHHGHQPRERPRRDHRPAPTATCGSPSQAETGSGASPRRAS